MIAATILINRRLPLAPQVPDGHRLMFNQPTLKEDKEMVEAIMELGVVYDKKGYNVTSSI